MMLFRSAKNSDLEAIFLLAQQSGIGMTTLPKNKALLKHRLQWSCNSYKKKLTEPINEYYFFVLEDSETKKVVGTSAIEAKIGFDHPFYSYKVSTLTRVCYSLKIRSEYELLTLVTDNQGHTEICTLFLEQDYRKNNNGLLLSKARFLFMAQHPERFASTVIAEMRGISNDNGESPFWDHVGFHFFHMPFSEADKLTLATDKQFIKDLMPEHPIYVKLLSPEAQAVIGKPHRSTVPAMIILMKEGFYYNNYIDIFDGGPTIESPLTEIKTFKSSHVLVVEGFTDEVHMPKYLVANTQLDYRATIDQVIIPHPEENSCTINRATATLLNVEIGDTIRIAPLQ